MHLKIMILFLFLFFLIGCDNPLEQNTSKLQLSFKNNSTFQLNNLSVSTKLIGNLPRYSSSRYIEFEKFRFDTGLPDEDANAEINGTILTNHFRGYWCGTEKITIDSGKYLIEVEVLDTMIFLSCKNAPRIDYP